MREAPYLGDRGIDVVLGILFIHVVLLSKSVIILRSAKMIYVEIGFIFLNKLFSTYLFINM